MPSESGQESDVGVADTVAVEETDVDEIEAVEEALEELLDELPDTMRPLQTLAD